MTKKGKKLNYFEDPCACFLQVNIFTIGVQLKCFSTVISKLGLLQDETMNCFYTNLLDNIKSPLNRARFAALYSFTATSGSLPGYTSVDLTPSGIKMTGQQNSSGLMLMKMCMRNRERSVSRFLMTFYPKEKRPLYSVM